jgi:hypothetical protein
LMPTLACSQEKKLVRMYIGEISEIAGVSIKVIRLYEEKGFCCKKIVVPDICIRQYKTTAEDMH